MHRGSPFIDNLLDNAQAVNTILYCQNWPEAVAFYRDRLGLRVAFENAWFVEFEVLPGAFLSVADAARSSIEAAGGRGLTITLRVPDADRIHARLEAAGLDVGPVTQHAWGARVTYLHDPEGNRLEFWSPSPGPTPG